MIRTLILALGIVALAVVPAQARDAHGSRAPEFRGHAFHGHHDREHRYGRFGYFGGRYSFVLQQYSYYCEDPPGYYPYIVECPEGWEVVPTP
jgi:hypothetical protein